MFLLFILLNVCYAEATTYHEYRHKFINTTYVKQNFTVDRCKEFCNRYKHCRSFSYKMNRCFISNTNNITYSIEDTNSTLYIKNRISPYITEHENGLFWLLFVLCFSMLSCIVGIYGRDICNKCCKKDYVEYEMFL